MSCVSNHLHKTASASSASSASPHLPHIVFAQDATGNMYDGITHAANINGDTYINMVQPGTNDTTGSPFPGGQLRLKNAGTVVASNQDFDVVITVPQNQPELSASLAMGYLSPNGGITQAAVTDAGYVCLGFEVPRSICPYQGTPDATTASCPLFEGEEGAVTQPTIMHGTLLPGSALWPVMAGCGRLWTSSVRFWPAAITVGRGALLRAPHLCFTQYNLHQTHTHGAQALCSTFSTSIQTRTPRCLTSKSFLSLSTVHERSPTHAVTAHPSPCAATTGHGHITQLNSSHPRRNLLSTLLWQQRPTDHLRFPATHSVQQLSSSPSSDLPPVPLPFFRC